MLLRVEFFLGENRNDIASDMHTRIRANDVVHLSADSYFGADSRHRSYHTRRVAVREEPFYGTIVTRHPAVECV